MLWVVLNAESYLLSNTVILWWLMPSDVTLLSNLPSLPGHKISSSVPQGEPPNRTAAKWTTWQWNRWQWGPTKWLMRYSNTQYTHTILLSLPFFSDCVWNFIKRIFYSKVLASNVKPRQGTDRSHDETGEFGAYWAYSWTVGNWIMFAGAFFGNT